MNDGVGGECVKGGVGGRMVERKTCNDASNPLIGSEEKR
jgi:hypothetical protein